MKNIKKFFIILFLFSLSFSVFANPFNNKITDSEKQKLENGEVIIRNINYSKNMCLNENLNNLNKSLSDNIKNLFPKYLAEVIQIRSYEGNEDLPDKLEKLLFNIPDYAGIPYYSERAGQWYNLYDSATIESIEKENNKTILNANLEMQPFGVVKEKFEYIRENDVILYIGTNQNKLRYLNEFDCVWPKKMEMCILLFKEDDKWILYGIGGVNAPRIPFFTERIETSFINRIKTFCNFIFTEL